VRLADDGTLRLPPSDLANHLPAPDPARRPTPARGGRDRFRRRGLEAAARRTEDALRAGVEVVYQGVLASGGWRGIADFLGRIEEPSSLGSFSYEAWDTKLARSAKPNAVLQLTFYSHELERIQGRLPERMRVVLGSGREEEFRPADFAFFRRSRDRVLAAPAGGGETYPWLVDRDRPGVEL